MPMARLKDISIHYELQGHGEPLLLIMGRIESSNALFKSSAPDAAIPGQRLGGIVLDRRGMQVRDIGGNLRDLARLDEAEFKEVDLNAVLRSTVDIARYELKKKDVRLEIDGLQWLFHSV